jgi:hypothetical protein
MARGSRVTDMHGWERPDVEVDCAKCHSGTAPHKNPTLAMLNEHTSLIACETCHIPWTSGASRRIWAPTFGMTNGPESSIPIFDAQSGVYEPYSVYTAEYNQRPAYRWFNGSVSMLAEPMDNANAWNFQVATKNTPKAKIYPFRYIVSGMVMDRRGFAYDPNYNTNYTMLAAMDAMAAPLKQMGFMRASGLNAQERAVLAQFPNLLNFDKETYVRTGNIQEAVNVGLGRLGMMMDGQDAWGMTPAMLSAVGSNFWSGDVLGLDLPNNPYDPTYNPLAPPTDVTGSFISLSHAIKRTGALNCNDCHSQTGVLDFNALSYTPTQATHLQTVLNAVQSFTSEQTAAGLRLSWDTIPGRTYQLQTATDLPGGVWTPYGGLMLATGRAMETVIPPNQVTAETQRFFRVKELAP